MNRRSLVTKSMWRGGVVARENDLSDRTEYHSQILLSNRADFFGHAHGSDADVAAVLAVVESYWTMEGGQRRTDSLRPS